MRRAIVLLSASLITLSASAAPAQNAAPRNLILFIPDGLRGKIVTRRPRPPWPRSRDKGVNFKNSHSLFPTFTMANGSADGERALSRRHRNVLEYDLHRLFVGAGRRYRRPLHRKRRGCSAMSTSISAATISMRKPFEDGARQRL